MAITKERLEELIEQEATIYTSRFKKPEKYKLYKDYFIDKDSLCVCNKRHTSIDCIIKLAKLFETKEDAEFALKYKNITRTETLSLPTWENFDGKFAFNILNQSYLLVNTKDDKGQYISVFKNVDNYKGYYSIFRAELTKENYYKALDLCVKLWKGEEV